uniref:Zgc:85932 n=1 Tax=Nothobranchius furzeri TaxID=105023 RepID=A0A8C6KKP3_NOTFU
CPSPQFIIDGASRLDICQGKLSDCWVLSAIASLSVHPSLLKKVVPLNQSFQDDYNGSFIFRFWQYGQWEEVRIDDFLPTQENQLIYLSSPERQEFWSSLLEKAYAKLKGGYRALDMGFPHEAMVDMTGGVAEVFSVSSMSRNLPDFLSYLLFKGALINCASNRGSLEQKNDLGIMFRHAYSLTAVEKVKTTHGVVDLVRILNPWGGTEWNGPWSDFNGSEWSTVSKEEQRRLGRVQQEDGEFWMSVLDFQLNFDVMEVCHLTEGLNEPGSSEQPWSCVMHHGSWYWQNPQYCFVLSEMDETPGSTQKTCSFILALMQKYQRRQGIHLTIGLHIYPVHTHANKHLSPDDLLKLQPVLGIQYSSRREVVLRGSLPPGHYIIIPSTAEPNQPGDFLLRVLMEPGNKHRFIVYSKLMDTISVKVTSDDFLCSVLAGSEKFLALEHCKSLVVLMDSQGIARLNWSEFQTLWDKIRKWTDIFLVFDKNKTKRLEYEEVCPALKAAGIMVDDLVMQLVGLRYTEPDMTISYPGFLYLVMKLERMIRKSLKNSALTASATLCHSVDFLLFVIFLHLTHKYLNFCL